MVKINRLHDTGDQVTVDGRPLFPETDLMNPRTLVFVKSARDSRLH